MKENRAKFRAFSTDQDLCFSISVAVICRMYMIIGLNIKKRGTTRTERMRRKKRDKLKKRKKALRHIQQRVHQRICTVARVKNWLKLVLIWCLLANFSSVIRFGMHHLKVRPKNLSFTSNRRLQEQDALLLTLFLLCRWWRQFAHYSLGYTVHDSVNTHTHDIDRRHYVIGFTE